LKASIPYLYTNFKRLYDIRHFDAFAAGLFKLKKPSGGPKGLIGPPCHGAPWPPEAELLITPGKIDIGGVLAIIKNGNI
jgi:hypothetical protein